MVETSTKWCRQNTKLQCTSWGEPKLTTLLWGVGELNRSEGSPNRSLHKVIVLHLLVILTIHLSLVTALISSMLCTRL